MCKKVNGRPYQFPDHPPLHKVRVDKAAPFSVTGMDLIGALSLRGRTSKAYICLFICASTKAVHLEVVTNLSTETFLRAFRRFVSRKYLPKIMMSDNGTTFVGASKELEILRKSPSVNETLSHLWIEWRFIPQRAPWYGVGGSDSSDLQRHR